MSRVDIPLIDRYAMAKGAIIDLEKQVDELRMVAATAVFDRASALDALDEIGKGGGKYAKMARDRAELIRLASRLQDES